jgi:hypothetical protein
MKSPVRMLLYGALGILGSERALADAIDPVTLTQLMIEDEAQDSILLGSAFGVDPTSPIRFTSNVDVAGATFSYASVPNSLYLGQSVSINGTGGSFNPITDTLSISSTIVLGAATISADGSISVILVANPKTDFYKRNFPKTPVPGGDAYDQECDSLTFPSGRSLATCQYTTLAGKVFGAPFTEADKYDAKTGAWNVSESAPHFAVAITSEGVSPPIGGTGTFTTTISAPEPATLPLLLSGLMVLPWARRRRNNQ